MRELARALGGITLGPEQGEPRADFTVLGCVISPALDLKELDIITGIIIFLTGNSLT
jgi:hypothetical protein